MLFCNRSSGRVGKGKPKGLSRIPEKCRGESSLSSSLTPPETEQMLFGSSSPNQCSAPSCLQHQHTLGIWMSGGQLPRFSKFSLEQERVKTVHKTKLSPSPSRPVLCMSTGLCRRLKLEGSRPGFGFPASQDVDGSMTRPGPEPGKVRSQQFREARYHSTRVSCHLGLSETA